MGARKNNVVVTDEDQKDGFCLPPQKQGNGKF